MDNSIRQELISQNPDWDQNISRIECKIVKIDGPYTNSYGDSYINSELETLPDKLIFKRRIFIGKRPDVKIGAHGKVTIATFNGEKFIVLPHENIDVAYRLRNI
jgi:hypothetical protein